MEQKHLVENNKMAFFCLLLVHACAFVMGFLYHKYLDYPRVIYYLLVVIGISTTLVGRLKFVESHKGHMIMLGGVALTYLVLLFSFYKKPFLYALTYLICVTIMLYRDKHMLTLGLIVACIGNFGMSNLSATSEEVAAASESALTVSNGAVEKMNETVAMLESVFDLSKKL